MEWFKFNIYLPTRENTAKCLRIAQEKTLSSISKQIAEYYEKIFEYHKMILRISNKISRARLLDGGNACYLELI